MADVIDDVLFGPGAAASTGEKNGNAATGIFWAVGVAVLAAVIYALASSGTLGGAWGKLKSSAGEMTAGLFGKKK